MVNSSEIEKKVREFLVDEMLKEQASLAEANEPLDFDSLDQTELRVYIQEEFDAPVEKLEQPFSTIGQIVEFVSTNAQ